MACLPIIDVCYNPRLILLRIVKMNIRSNQTKGHHEEVRDRASALLEPLLRLQALIRDEVVAACERADLSELSQVVMEEEGDTIYAAKKPRDAKAHAEAQSDLERRQAYCYCPLVRTKMDQDMPLDFCNCGAGWFRQQWEGATGKPVTMEIVQSVLRGDEKCEFAVHLAKDI